MKKILMTLAIIGLAYYTSSARISKKVCGSTSDKVCRMSSKGRSCYNTKYAENFKVCKNNHGYFICCETPNRYNSTHPGFSVPAVETVVAISPAPVIDQYENATAANNQVSQDLIAPQSQSYPPNSEVYRINNGISYESASSYEGYYPAKGRIKVCYYGDNVAEDNRMPYQGCPSPQYDGPEKNAQRNINVTTPSDLPPINGWGHK